METKTGNVKKLDPVNFFKVLRFLFKDIKSGRVIYLSFSRNNFYVLIYTLAIGTAANIALLNFLLRNTRFITDVDIIIVIFQSILSAIAVVAGAWLFFKGINIVTDK